MTKEKSFLIRILSDFILEKSTQVPEGLDWESLIELSRRQQVEGIVYYQCKGSIPTQYRFECMKAYMLAVHFYENRVHFLEQFAQKAKEQGIDHFVVKGTAAAAFYPVPAQRTMGDTDIVIRTKDRDRVGRIMEQLGCKLYSDFEDREWIYQKDKMLFEVHDHLLYSETVTEKKHARFFNDFWKYYRDGALDESFHFLFLIVHLRKHFMNSGVGFRQFMDIAVSIKNNAQLDWQYISDSLEELQLLDFAKVCFAFCERWFGVPSPMEGVVIEDAFFEQSTAKIFADGIFGFDNETNLKNEAVNRARKSKNRILSMLLSLLRRFFPSYSSMILSGNYPFLKGRAYLLPFAWLYRFYRGIRYRYVDDGKQLAQNAFVSSEQLKERVEMLEKWGL